MQIVTTHALIKTTLLQLTSLKCCQDTLESTPQSWFKPKRKRMNDDEAKVTMQRLEKSSNLESSKGKKSANTPRLFQNRTQ